MTSLAGRTLLRAAEMLQADACALADAERVNRPNCDLANRASATFSVYQRAWVERSSASTLCVALWPANGRGDQRSSAGLPAGARRARAGRGMSPSNTRITRSNPTTLGSNRATADARTQTPGVRARHRHRTRLRAESARRPLRDHRWPAYARSGPRRVRRAGLGHMTSGKLSAIPVPARSARSNATEPRRIPRSDIFELRATAVRARSDQA